MPLYFFALIFFIFTSPAYAIDQMYNWNGLEFVTSGNVTHVHPASPESTRLRGGWVVEFPADQPEIRAKHQLPYKNKGGSGAVIEVRPKVDPGKVAAKAKDAIKAGAAGLASGGGYVALASITCSLLCDAAVEALKDWGVDRLSVDSDGDFSVSVPSDSQVISDGYVYTADDFASGSYYSWMSACLAGIEGYSKTKPPGYVIGISSNTIEGIFCEYAVTGGYTGRVQVRKTPNSSCPAGMYIVSGQCLSEPSQSSKSISDYFLGKYTGKGWSHHWAKMTAKVVEEGGNVFTDGTSVGITGPALVPLSTSETRSSVNLIPGTNTPAPVGHTGPTDPGTQTTTTTTTAKNTYTPAPFSSSSGPSMTTTQQTQTVTNITNNITNITTTENTTITESDDSPEKEQKDFCEQNPDSLACAELDTPEAEIPRDTVNITFAPENLGLGAGTCPADKQIGPHTFSYAATCDILASYVKPLVIALALFGALLIVFVGKADA